MNLKRYFTRKNLFRGLGFTGVLLAIVGGAYFYLFQYLPNQPRVNYFFLERNEWVRAQISKDGAKDLPDQLVIGPGEYNFYGKKYSLQKEGLYRFLKGKEIKNRIVYKNDPYAIISGIAWIEGPTSKNGKRGKMKMKEVVEKIKDRNIGLSCGDTTSLGATFLNRSEIKTRNASGLDTDYSWTDTSDNGHTILEVMLNGRWAVIDLENNVQPQVNGANLTFWELYNRVNNNEPYEFKRLANDETGRRGEELKAYYRNVFKVPLLLDGKKYAFTAEGERKEKASTYAKIYYFLPREEWLEKFYAGYGYK